VVFEKATTLSIFQRLWLWHVRIVTNRDPQVGKLRTLEFAR